MHSQTHTCTHARTNTYTHTLTGTLKRTDTLTRTDALTHTHSHAHRRTHTLAMCAFEFTLELLIFEMNHIIIDVSIVHGLFGNVHSQRHKCYLFKQHDITNAVNYTPK